MNRCFYSPQASFVENYFCERLHDKAKWCLHAKRSYSQEFIVVLLVTLLIFMICLVSRVAASRTCLWIQEIVFGRLFHRHYDWLIDFVAFCRKTMFMSTNQESQAVKAEEVGQTPATGQLFRPCWGSASGNRWSRTTKAEKHSNSWKEKQLLNSINKNS